MIAQRLLDIPFIYRSDALRSFITAAWLGWQVESNWASPGLFAIYSIVRPLAGALILVVMYSVISRSGLEDPLFGYVYMGNALYILVVSIVGGVSVAVTEDREHYRTMKQLHTAPLNYFTYLMGRGVARMGVGSISVVLTILFGVIAFRLPLSLSGIQWGFFLASLLLGIASMGAMGIIIASLTMQMARHFWSIGDSVTGALFLFTGAIFPLDVLPAALRPIGFALPTTYWLEAARRALLPNAPRFPTLAGISDVGLIAILAGMSVLLGGLSLVIYRWSLHQAKEKGILDMETSY